MFPVLLSREVALVIKKITSTKNPLIKSIMKIKKEDSKASGGKIFFEGRKICDEAFEAGINIEYLLVDEEYYETGKMSDLNFDGQIYVLSDEAFDKISYSRKHGEIAGVAQNGIYEFQRDKTRIFAGRDKGMYLVCENVQDPGNFGNIIRSAEAFGFSGILFTKENANPFNEKVIRASMGSVFHIPLIYSKDMKNALTDMKKLGFTVYGTDIKGESIENLSVNDKKVAVVLGNEGSGMSLEAKLLCDKLLRIPMTGRTESLNVAGAASIICYVFGKNFG